MTTRACLVVLALSLLSACSDGPKEDGSPPAVGGTLSEDLTFDVPAADAWKAVEEALEGGESKVERRHRDECGGKLVARREDGHRVTVTIHAPERRPAEIAVYVEPADRELVEAIQTRIGEKLSLKKARAQFFGESQIEASYELELDHAIGAVERTCRALSLEITSRLQEEMRARVEARGREARLVRFLLSRPEAGAGETRVVFETETTSAGGEKEFLRKVRRELEHHLFPPAD
jgi:hypothetical protein